MQPDHASFNLINMGAPLANLQGARPPNNADFLARANLNVNIV